ncbi:MAG: NADH-quinone oxidoreductase subunit NuoG [Burkholderiaceae bacterium]
MIELEIDGKKVEVPAGSMLMDAAHKLGLYVPHFCYHKKLSIAANCRMCLVEVEKAPKPLPACATPVAAGMKVFTASEKAKLAQQGVMEFLLINHPLDCPICDQGGECQLQDLAVGYGPSASHYSEAKRVVFHKPMGPLISAQEMSRCIHCTRCVRFGQEIAGVMELGMAHRGEHSEIMSFVGGAVQSELSGNMIDVCPVGALTSKPFRYAARTWELSRRRSISPHDGLGSNLVVQSKAGKVLRVVPLENEAVNECWISDRDRFSYEALNSDDRLTTPMVRDERGQWREADWHEALEKAASILKSASARGANRVRALMSPMVTVEEAHLASKLIRGLKSQSIDFRVALSDPQFDQALSGSLAFGFPVAEFSSAQRVLLVGSQLRAEQPLIAQRIRQAVRQGAQLASLSAMHDALLMPVHASVAIPPSHWVTALESLVTGLSHNPAPKTTKAKGSKAKAKEVEAADSSAESSQMQALHSWLSASNFSQSGDETPSFIVVVGEQAVRHPEASRLIALAQQLARARGGKLAVLTPGANWVGASLAGALPQSNAGGKSAVHAFEDPASAYLLCQLEPALDCFNGPTVVAGLKSGLGVVALTSYRSAVDQVADVMLPMAPFTETSGSFVNMEGRLQSFEAAVPPAGQTRPGWKILRVLGNMLDLEGFDQNSSDQVRAQALEGYAPQANGLLNLGWTLDESKLEAQGQVPLSLGHAELERLPDLPIYMVDSIVRRADSLRQTQQSGAPKAWLHPEKLKELSLVPGMSAKVRQDDSEVVLELASDPRLALDVIRFSLGHPTLQAIHIGYGKVFIKPVTKASQGQASAVGKSLLKEPS